MTARGGWWLALAGAAASLAAVPAGAVTFVFTPVANDTLTPDQSAAFQTAADYWSRSLADPITIYVQIGFRSLGTNVLGGASTALYGAPATSVRAGLVADAKSLDDAAAVATLPAFGTTDQIAATSAQLKALGFGGFGTASDGTIEFNVDYSYSTSRNADGTIAAGTFDLVGIAEHEIGHVLGFLSTAGTGVGVPTILDEYRFSAPATRTSANGAAYFSLDNGATAIASFSDGITYQPSHWQNGTTSDGRTALMDPAIAAGAVQNITLLDLRAFDVIGYDLTTPVPEPLTWTTMIAGFCVMGAALRRAHRRSERRFTARIRRIEAGEPV